MKTIHYTDIPPTSFNSETATGVSGRVVIGKADGAGNFCMRAFEVASGGHTPRHTHAWEHEIFVHAGTGEVYGQGKWHPVGAGSVVFVPAGEEHQIRSSGDEPLMFICLIPSGAPEL